MNKPKRILWIGITTTFVLISIFNKPMLHAQSNLTGDPVVGKSKAQLCAACHGAEGVSINPLWPNLAGQQEQYLVKATTSYREGDRVEPTMQPFVQNLTDQDIADLAAYYSSLTPCP